MIVSSVRVNMNAIVQFRLTEEGERAWKEIAETEARIYKLNTPREIPYYDGSQKLIRMTLWDFANFLGERFIIGGPLLIQDNEIEIFGPEGEV